MATEFTIQLLGSPAINGSFGSSFFPAKAFQLLAMLSVSDGHRMTRKEAASMLWDSSSDASALSNLRQLIVRLRKATNDRLLEVDFSAISLGADKNVLDLVRFEQLMGSADLGDRIEAAHLLQGDLLNGIDDVSDAFSHWLTRERGALRERFFVMASTSLLELTKFGRAPERHLQTFANRLLELEPEREQSYRLLIEAYGRNGQYAAAANVYGRLKDMLQKEFAVAPSSETAAVARRVFASKDVYAAPYVPATDAVEVPRVAFLMPFNLAANGGFPLLRYFLEDVANELSRKRSFVVIAPHSSFQSVADGGVPENNDLLRATYAITGFVKPDRDGRVLALKMCRCSSGEIVWSAEFSLRDEELTQSFSLLAARMATGLSASIERDRLRIRHANKEAYLRFLEGQQLLDSCDLIHLRRARSHFKAAIATAPRFALPRARIAQTLYLEWIQLGGLDPSLLNLAGEQAEIAQNLDPHDATGQWMRGTVALYQRDFDTCEAALAEAETLAPNSADLLLQHGDALSHLGRPDSGWQKFEQALSLNPLPPEHYWWAGASIAFRQQDFGRAIELCGRLRDDEPVLSLLAASHAWLGDRDRAEDYGRRIKEIFPGDMAVKKSMTVTPDKDPTYRTLSVEGLRMAGVF